ncbi:MAG TPA: hypothetical protein VFM57_14690, partial [Thermoleophilaceae bacterium]|nr:hypothetical protein [Thermoleophilaceae bacterium]
ARPIVLALAALLVTAVLAVAIALAASGGGDQAGTDKSVSVTLFAPTAGDSQRSQPPGVNGPTRAPNHPRSDQQTRALQAEGPTVVWALALSRLAPAQATSEPPLPEGQRTSAWAISPGFTALDVKYTIS